MAHYTRTPLNNQDSQIFLESLGLVNIESCSTDSVWSVYGGIQLFIPPDTIVMCNNQIFNIIFEAGTIFGYHKGVDYQKEEFKNAFLTAFNFGDKRC